MMLEGFSWGLGRFFIITTSIRVSTRHSPPSDIMKKVTFFFSFRPVRRSPKYSSIAELDMFPDRHTVNIGSIIVEFLENSSSCLNS